MSDYTKQLQKLVAEYRQQNENRAASTTEIASWALENHKYDVRTPTVLRLLSRELAQAMREEYTTDKKGRRVRSKHPAPYSQNGQTVIRWDDRQTAQREHMVNAFQWHRNRIVGECKQLKNDVDSYNEDHPQYKQIPLILDFTNDVAEAEALAQTDTETNDDFELAEAA